jgi:phage terminase large subunit-like protein
LSRKGAKSQTPVTGLRPTGTKAGTRVGRGHAEFCSMLYVRLCAGEWQLFFLDELESFPFGKRRDQGDAASGAFNHLTGGSTYSLYGGALD